MRIHRLALASAAAVLSACIAQAADKIPITKQDDLPRHTYAVAGDVQELVRSPEAIGKLATEVRKDLESDLAKYDIQDKKTLQGIHQQLLAIDLIEERYDDVLARVVTIRELEDKEALKLTSGIGAEVRIATIRELGSSEITDEFKSAYGRRYRERLEALPWEVVQDQLQGTKAQMEMLSENLLAGVMKEQLQPIVDQAKGEVSAGVVAQLLSFHQALTFVLPLQGEVVGALTAVTAVHREDKVDIWAARSLDLSGKTGLSPVTIAVWDTGVDTDVFAGKVFTNAAEKPNGKDDDGNGFVDDVHGIGYDQHWNRIPGTLYPIGQASRPAKELQKEATGLFDMQAALDTPEAKALREKMASLGADEVKTFLEDLGHYTMYSHGTHVAGIAVDGNPAASVLVCRLTGDPKVVPDAPTMEECRRAAEEFPRVIDYYKKHGVRVVNMSWVIARSSFEHDLEANGIGKDAEDRKRMAREMFEVMRESLYEAFRSAPEIVFVGGAGNSDNDIRFDEFFPPMFELPNLLIAGAVDQAGEATSFTSFGSTVNVYSNGFEVESYVPGGDRVKFSGTSMASPNVANLAAKLIALDPSLAPPDVIALIRDGADEVHEGEHVMKIINPKRSAELLAERRS